MSQATIKVALDGSTKFKKIQDAIDSIPINNKQRVIIRVGPGIYKQPIYVPKTKNLITLLGDKAETTVITWSNTATAIQHHLVSTNCNYFTHLTWLCNIMHGSMCVHVLYACVYVYTHLPYAFFVNFHFHLHLFPL